MRKLYLLLLGLGCGVYAHGQKVEVSIVANSGLSRFGGESAAKTTAVSIYGVGTPRYYNNNPYGNRHTLTYGGSMQLQRVMSQRFLLGAQTGFEQLRSRVEINRVDDHWSYSSSMSHPAEGESLMKANFMNLYPYVGWRILDGEFDFDMTLGSDIGFSQKLAEEGKATIKDGTTIRAAREYGKIGTDLRPRLGVAIYRGNAGASVSYAHGLTNYLSGQGGNNSEVYMRVFRLGLHYRL